MLIRPLSPVLADKAKDELNETPNKLEDGIQHLKEWIAKQPHLNARTDDQWLAAFLRGCKHRLERAKEKIDLYYSLRNIYPELYAFRPNDPRFNEMLRTGSILILPKLSSPVAPRVGIVRIALSDPKKYSAFDFFSLTYILQQIMFLEDDAFLVNGNIGILDFKGATLSHLLQVSPRHLKKMMAAGQDASPLRLKSLHLINCLPIFEKMFHFAKKLLSEKLRKRVFVYSSDLSGLSVDIPKDILPVEYGGTGGAAPELIDYWIKKVDDYGSWLEEDIQNYGTNESLRPVKGKEKSNKQIEID